MAHQTRPGAPEHVRREELVRPVSSRRQFASREAQRYFERRDHPRWALIAYAIVLAAVAIIGSITYTTYAFSRYRGEILPGVSIDNRYVGEMTSNQALTAVYDALQPVYNHPIVLTFAPCKHSWAPRPGEIGYRIFPRRTVAQAQLVGRHESFPEQLLDRMPIHPHHTVPLSFSLRKRDLNAYISNQINPDPCVHTPMVDAGLKRTGNRFAVSPSKAGQNLNIQAADGMIASALGTLSTPSLTLPVVDVPPHVPDSVARNIRDQVNGFLAHPPVYSVGKNVNQIPSSVLADMLSFSTIDHPTTREIKMDVNQTRVQAFVNSLASLYDRAPQNPRFDFSGRTVQVMQPGRSGRQLDMSTAYRQVLVAVTGLRARARIHLRVATVAPAQDEANPASLGIRTLLSVGTSGFTGAGSTRLQDIQQIVQRLDNTLIRPNQDISFNSLAGLGWDSRVYADRETRRGGVVVPADSGAMQQVATTWFRALFGAGLDLRERHAHTYRLKWYERPIGPVGTDAVVSSDGNEDLIFHNQTGKYLFIKTHVEPVRQELYVYVYGPAMHWQIKFASNVLAIQPHPPKKLVHDDSLAPGQTRQLAFAHDGMRTSYQRTIVYPNGKVSTATVYTHYQPWQAVYAVGIAPSPTPKPTPKPGARSTPSPTPGPTPGATGTAALTPSPQPTATFDH